LSQYHGKRWREPLDHETRAALEALRLDGLRAGTWVKSFGRFATAAALRDRLARVVSKRGAKPLPLDRLLEITPKGSAWLARGSRPTGARARQ
jgi:hypothetical protein